MFTPLRRARVAMVGLLAVTFFASMSVGQLCRTTPCVTTWHNDNNRTGWQQYETTLCATTTVSQP